MKRKIGVKLVVWSLAVLVVAAFGPSASAAVVGHLSVENCTGGGVTVSLSQIDWFAPSPPSTSVQCLALGGGTSITSVGDGNLTPISFTPPAGGTINDLPPASNDAGFMSFVSASPFIDLPFNLYTVGGFGPGSATACTAGMAVGTTCSLPGSPFLLTYSGSSSGTSVTLDAQGYIVDVGDGKTSYWSGSFTTQIYQPTNNIITPFDIQTLIDGGGTITSSFSGEFDVTDVPEPVSMALIGGGLIGLAAIKRRKRV